MDRGFAINATRPPSLPCRQASMTIESEGKKVKLWAWAKKLVSRHLQGKRSRQDTKGGCENQVQRKRAKSNGSADSSGSSFATSEMPRLDSTNGSFEVDRGFSTAPMLQLCSSAAMTRSISYNPTHHSAMLGSRSLSRGPGSCRSHRVTRSWDSRYSIASDVSSTRLSDVFSFAEDYLADLEDDEEEERAWSLPVGPTILSAPALSDRQWTLNGFEVMERQPDGFKRSRLALASSALDGSNDSSVRLGSTQRRQPVLSVGRFSPSMPDLPPMDEEGR